MTIRSLSDGFDLSGEWYLPKSPDSLIAGQLKYTSERTELYLNDAITPMSGDISVSDASPAYPVIYGNSSTGEAVTLLHAQRMGISLNIGSGGMRQPERVLSSWLVLGAHVPLDQLYSRVQFRIPGLEVWLSRPSISQEYVEDPETGQHTHNFSLLSTNGEKTHVPAIDSTLEWGVSVKSSVNPFTSISVEMVGFVNITPSTPQSMEWFIEQQSKLVAMLTFLAGTPMPIDSIGAYLEDSATLVTVLVAMRQAARCEFKNPHDFFIPRNAVGIDFSTLVENWFREIDAVLIPSQLALSVFSSKNLWLHVEFASLIQALEGFHRSRYEGKYMNDKSYETVKKSLSDAIPIDLPTDHKEALRSRIRYGNQISLSKRLSELKESLGVSLACLIISDTGKIPRNWIDTRNYHSHWDEELRANIIDGQEMYHANTRMQHFVRVLYLMLMGISAEVLTACFKNYSNTSQELIQLNIIARRKLDPSQPSGVIMSITAVPGPLSRDTGP
jgi:hypothetical protein